MSPEVVELLIPMVLFTVFGLIWIAFFYFRYKTRVHVQETIQTALDKGAELTPELIDRMVSPPKEAETDLRRGIVGIFLGLAFVLFALILGEKDAVRPLMAIGVFPFLVGFAYLAMWKYARETDSSE